MAKVARLVADVRVSVIGIRGRGLTMAIHKGSRGHTGILGRLLGGVSV
jgi:hypothetical protein